MLEHAPKPLSLIPSSSKRPISEYNNVSTSKKIFTIIDRVFSTSTLILLGAAIQGTLILAVPRFWMLAPTLIILSVRFFDTLAVALKFRPNPYLDDVIASKWSVNVPDVNGEVSSEPATEKIAVLLLCAKINHPMGMLATNAKELGDFADAMAVELDNNAENNGFLGQSEWESSDSKGATELLLLSYWRSIEDIHRYSESDRHRAALKWWDAQSALHKVDHIGIDHEIFEAPRNKWEKIAINFQPTRLGATSYLRRGDKLVGGIVDDQWISPVIEAKGKYRTSRGRLNWQGESSLLHDRDEYWLKEK